jgi:hypothetical protein
MQPVKADAMETAARFGRAKVDPAMPYARELQALALRPAARIDLGGWLKSAGAMPERAVGPQAAADLAGNLLVLPPASAPAPEALGVDALRALLLDPVYQLK